MLSIQDIQALLRASQAETGRRPYSKTAQGLVDSLGFGRIVGKQWLTTQTDRDRIREYLRTVEGIDPTTSADAWQGRNRIESSELGRNEKLARRRPRDGRIAVRALGELYLAGSSFNLPSKASLEIPLETSVDLRHDIIVLIENFEAFIHFEDAKLKMPYSNPLLVFRGDSDNRLNAVIEFLKNNTLSVYSWPDLDPAGLLLSSTLPGIAGIIGPDDPEKYLKQYGRSDLFLNQMQQLDSLRLTGECTSLEEAIHNQRKGGDQERMISCKTQLRVWTI